MRPANLVPEKGAFRPQDFVEAGGFERTSISREADEALFKYLDHFIGILQRQEDAGRLKRHELDALEAYKELRKRLGRRKEAIDGQRGLWGKKKDMRIFHNKNEMALGLLALEEVRRHHAAALAYKIIDFPSYASSGPALSGATVRLNMNFQRAIPSGVGKIIHDLGGRIITARGGYEVEFENVQRAYQVISDFVETSGFKGSKIRIFQVRRSCIGSCRVLL